MTRSNAHSPLLGLSLGFLGVALFSLTLPMTRIAVAAMDAPTVAVWRGLIAAVSAAMIILLFYRKPLARHRILPLLLTGVGIVLGFPFFITLAMQTIPASHGAIVIGLLPITTAIVNTLVTREHPSIAFWLVSAVGTIAIFVFILRQGGGQLEVGHYYLILAVLFGAVGYTFGGNIAKEIGGPLVVCWALVLMSPLLIAAVFFVAPIPRNVSPNAIGALLYLALVSQLTGFFAWYTGLAIGGVARVSQVQLLQIFMTLAFSALLLSEPLNSEIFFFATLVVSCVLISTRLRIDAKKVAVGN